MAPTSQFRLEGRRVWVAGHRGMVGSALVRRLASEGCEVLTIGHAELDLRRQADVERWMKSARPEAVIIAAARVGGILENSRRPAEFLHDNIAMQDNVINCAAEIGVDKLLFLGSSCVYPRLAPQPISENSLLTSALEPTNQWYSIAKIAGIMQCQAYREQYGCDFISAMPTNLYGPGDNFDLEGSHVLPALLRRFHAAKIEGEPEIDVWGTGTPRREFLHVDDCADALVFLLKSYSEVGHHQRRDGHGSDHRRARRNDRRCRRLSRPHRVRSVQARRHAAQAAQCRAGFLRADGAQKSDCAKASSPRTHGSASSSQRAQSLRGFASPQATGQGADERRSQAPTILSSRS